MIYKVISVDITQTSIGKPMKRLGIEGVEKKINIFSDFPHYAEINEGSTIDAEIRKNDKGYDNLYSNEIKSRSGAYNTDKTASITKAMEKKEVSIGKFQDNKELSIKIASTMSGAIALTVAEYKDKTVLDTLDDAVIKWRRFLWKHWDDPETDATYPD